MHWAMAFRHHARECPPQLVALQLIYALSSAVLTQDVRCNPGKLRLEEIQQTETGNWELRTDVWS